MLTSYSLRHFYFNFFYMWQQFENWKSLKKIELNCFDVSQNSFSNRCWKIQPYILKNKHVLFLKYMWAKSVQVSILKKWALFTDPGWNWGLGSLLKVFTIIGLPSDIYSVQLYCSCHHFLHQSSTDFHMNIEGLINLLRS